MRATAVLLLLGCGVPGAPLPPGPLPPAAPSDVRVVRTAEGLEITATPPTTDVNGNSLSGRPQLLLFVDAPTCAGRPAAASLERPLLRLPMDEPRSMELRLVASLAGRRGDPAPPVTVEWSAPPPPPEAPIAFADGAGVVQLTWLPPPAPVDEVRVVRDGQAVATVPAADSLYADSPDRGSHQYQLQGVGPGFRTAPSPNVTVEVP